MKGVMKRFAALAMTIAMLIGFIPSGMIALGQGLDWAGDAATVTYNFKLAKKGALKTGATEYGTGNTNWKYNAQSVEGKTTGAGYDTDISETRMNYYNKNEEGFLALDVKLPATAGKYTLKMSYLGLYGGKNISLYILPKDTASIATALTTATPVGTFVRPESEGTSTTYTREFGVFEVTEALAGEEAILVMQIKGISLYSGRWTDNYGIIAYDIKLDGQIPPEFTSVELTSSKNVILEGKTAQLSIKALRSDGTEQDLKDATVVYSTEDTDVVNVDATTGVVTWKGVGYATVKVSVTVGAITKTDTVEIRCREMPSGPPAWEGAASSVTYDLRYGYEENTAFASGKKIVETLPEYNAETNPNWYYTPQGWFTSNEAKMLDGWFRYTNGSSHRKCITLMLKLPDTPGKYAVKIGHRSYYCTPEADFFLYPADTTKAYENFHDGKVNYANQIGHVDFYQNAEKPDDLVYSYIGTVTVDAETAGTEKMLTIYTPTANPDAKSVADGGQGTHGIYFRYITFDGTGEPEFAKTAVVSGKQHIFIGDKITLDALAQLADGTNISMDGATVKFTSKTPLVASVNETTGEVTALAKGEAIIEASITIDGVTQVGECKIQCHPPLTFMGEEYTEVYDFRYGVVNASNLGTAFPSWKKWAELPQEYNADTNPNWAYYPGGWTSDTRTTTKRDWMRYGSSTQYRQCLTARIKLPETPGKYQIKFVHNGYYCAPKAALYLYPTGRTDYYNDFREGAIKDDYLLNEITLKQDPNLADVQVTKNVAIFEVTPEMAGQDRVFVLRATEQCTDNKSLTDGEQLAWGIHFRYLIFDAVEPSPLASVNLKVLNETISKEAPTKAIVSGLLEDGTAADLDEKNISVVSSDPTTIKIDKDGTVTGLKDGTATLTATVTLNGITKTTSATVACVSYGGAVTDDEINLMAGLAENGERVDLLTEYNSEKNARWRYFGNYMKIPTGYAESSDGNVKFRAVDDAGWSAIKFMSNKAGLYQLSLAYSDHNGAKGVKAYLLPASNLTVAQIDDELIDETLIGKASLENTSEEKIITFGEVALRENYEYILVLQADGVGSDINEGYATVSATKLLFSGEKPAPVIPTLSEVTLDVVKLLAVNGSKVATVTGKMSDGSDADLTSATITYSSSDTNVIEIDANTGSMLGKALGDSTITVTVSLDGEPGKSDSETVSVVADENLTPAGESIKKVYNMHQSYKADDDFPGGKINLSQVTDYHPTRNPDWKTGITPASSQIFYGYVRNKADSPDDILGFVLKMPDVPGVYNFSMGYRTAYGTTKLAAYEVPMTSTDIAAELTDDNLIGTISLVMDRYKPDGIKEEIFGQIEVQPYEVGQEKLIVFKALEPQTDEWMLTNGGVGQYGFYFKTLALTGEGPLSHLTLTIDGKTINTAVGVGRTGQIVPKTPGYETEAGMATYQYESLTPEFATVSDTGLVTGVKSGVAKIKVTATLNGVTREIEFPVVIGTVKPGVSFYTEEMRANALENANAYDWAADTQKAAIKAADQYLGREEYLWNLPTTQKLPRGVYATGDPEYRICRYCKTDIATKYGGYGWVADAAKVEWKVMCPECRRFFPSNDFGKYYALGIDEHGNWDPELSKQKNDEIVANGGDGYLKNVLYPEMDEYTDKEGIVHNEGVHNWGVDDGYGYRSGKVFSNGAKEIHGYIAYYNFQAVWQTAGAHTSGGLVCRALFSLGEAYLYTGEEKYGIAGAILIDRVADIYPDFDISDDDGISAEFVTSSGGAHQGTVLGRIGDCAVANRMLYSYDIFWPEMDNPKVISFLSEKAKQYNMDNPKTSADLIRFNCDNGIVRAIRKGVYNTKIWGNFGLQQRTMATAAVVLDTMPESGEWIDWLFAPSATGGTGAGGSIGETGNIYGKLVNDVDRDGWGNESSPAYNVDWINAIIDVASALETYKEKYPAANLYEYPKYVQMINVSTRMLLAEKYTPLIGDNGQFAVPLNIANRRLKDAWDAGLKSDLIAKQIYKVYGGNLKSINSGMFKKDPEKIQREIAAVIAESGEILDLGSENLAGYGLMMTRDGMLKNANNSIDTQRSLWMFYGSTSGHGHYDKLNLGVIAYGIDMSPDMGNPDTKTSGLLNRDCWTDAHMSHNTVLVVEKTGDMYRSKVGNWSAISTPMHFDDSGKVKVMDVDAPEVFNSTDIYRRTVVSVDANDDISYAVDFYRVKGGDDHIYNFHAQSEEIEVDIPMVAQTNENGEFVGSYAGPDAPYGYDPLYTGASNCPLQYHSGFVWLKNIYRAANPQAKTISADFKIKDFFNVLPGNPNLHMKLTMLNTDNEITEFAYGDARPSLAKGAPELYKQIMARRQGKNLDSLFTTVIQPYKDAPYILSVEEAPITVKSGFEGKMDASRAVKVTLEGGRVDYVVYTTNNNVAYTVDNKFDFQGFVGVVTYDANAQNGTPIYTYMNDGKQIAGMSGIDAYTGTVVDFTKEMAMENSITVEFDGSYDIDNLKGHYIYVDNGGAGTGQYNGAYRIEGAKISESDPSKVILDIGMVTTIRKYTDVSVNWDFTYNIAEGQSFRIPLPTYDDASPIIDVIPKQTVEAGNTISFRVTATSQTGNPLSYKMKDSAEGMVFDEVTQTFSWTPSSADRGDNFVSFVVSDGLLESVLYVDINVANSTGGNVADGDTIPGDSDPGDVGGGGGGGGSDEPKPEEPKPEEPEDPTVTPGGDSGKKFVDLGAHSWAEEAIYRLVEAGVINGTSANTYSPAKNITRADFATLIVRLFKFEGEAETFTDVPESKYYAESVGIAKANGIVNGVSETEFAPLKEISREDMMVMLYRALKAANVELEETVELTHSDFDEVSDYAKEAVSALIKSGLIAGSNGKINPKATATRAEVAVVLNRIYGLIGK